MSFDIGINNTAHEGEKGWVGVNDVARQIEKMWVGDADGKARLFWSIGSGGDKLFMVANEFSTKTIYIASATIADGFAEGDMVQQGIIYNGKLFHPFCVNGKYIIYYGENSSSQYIQYVLYSDDLVNWTETKVSDLLYAYPTTGEKRTYCAIFYKNGRFIATIRSNLNSQNTQKCLESFDGFNWTEKGTIYTDAMNVNGLEYGLINGVMQYVIATNKGIFYSTDLVSWTRKDTTSYSSVYGMTVDENKEVFLLNSTTLYNLTTGNKGTASGVSTGTLFSYDDENLLLCPKDGAKLIKKPTSESGSLAVQTLYSRGTTRYYGKASRIKGVYYATMATAQTTASDGSYRPSNVVMEYSTDAVSWTRKVLRTGGNYDFMSEVQYEENY